MFCGYLCHGVLLWTGNSDLVYYVTPLMQIEPVQRALHYQIAGRHR